MLSNDRVVNRVFDDKSSGRVERSRNSLYGVRGGYSTLLFVLRQTNDSAKLTKWIARTLINYEFRGICIRSPVFTYDTLPRDYLPLLMWPTRTIVHYPRGNGVGCLLYIDL